MARLDVTVVPSIWYEVGPLSMLESFAAGTPVVASPLGNMADLLQDGINGLHFRPGDEGHLAQQLQSLIDQPSLLERLRAGVKPPRSIDDEMQQLITIYNSVFRHTILSGADIYAP
jgi:glycosyltransferase involved in cell wall biosynthesis